jgi:hypothetical protein
MRLKKRANDDLIHSFYPINFPKAIKLDVGDTHSACDEALLLLNFIIDRVVVVNGEEKGMGPRQ